MTSTRIVDLFGLYSSSFPSHTRYTRKTKLVLIWILVVHVLLFNILIIIIIIFRSPIIVCVRQKLRVSASSRRG